MFLFNLNLPTSTLTARPMYCCSLVVCWWQFFMSFGVVPFSRLPRKRYRPEQEPHVIRVDLDHLRNTVSEYNSDEDEDPTGLDDLERLSHSSGDDSSASSSSSYSSYSSLSSKHSPLNQQNISTLGSHHSNRSNNFDKTNYDENDDQDSVSSLHTRTTIAATNTMNLPTVTTPVVTRKNKTILNSFLKSIQRYIKSRRSYVLFQLWRERKAKERRSAMLINLEKKGEILKEKIYNEIQQELLEDEM